MLFSGSIIQSGRRTRSSSPREPGRIFERPRSPCRSHSHGSTPRGRRPGREVAARDRWRGLDGRVRCVRTDRHTPARRRPAGPRASGLVHAGGTARHVHDHDGDRSMELARRGVPVTRLSAAEDAATMDTLCSDKTGTITTNTLSVAGVAPANGMSDDVLRYGALARWKQTAILSTSRSSRPHRNGISRRKTSRGGRSLHSTPGRGGPWRLWSRAGRHSPSRRAP